MFYLMSKKGDNQNTVDITENKPDQYHDQVLHKGCGESVSDQQELFPPAERARER